LAVAKKRTEFRAGTEARRRARLAASQPPGEKVIPDRRKKPARHKKKWLETELE
jgi:hypothetical protein